MNWIKKHAFSIVFAVMFLIGLSLLLYPLLSDYWNSFHQSRVILNYEAELAKLDETDYERLWMQAQMYNEALQEKENRWALTREEEEQYEELLNAGGNGVMGSIEIPSIDVKLPIYHGTDEGVLEIAIGHLQGTSLPTGGEGTHCVVSGHRGLPSAMLFTNLDRLAKGDLFTLQVLNRTLTYEVDQIRIVEPDDVSCLAIEEGQDLCTLVTCTPYGVNTHRLLVRGHRVETAEGEQYVSADAYQIEPWLVASAIAAPVLLVLLLVLLCSPSKKKAEEPSGDRKGGMGE